MGKKKENVEIEDNEVVEKKFTKEQLISSKLFRKDKDILSAIIEDNEELSVKEAQEKIENFKKGKVK